MSSISADNNTGIAASSVSASSADSGMANTIANLEKQIVALQKKLAKLVGSGTKDAAKQAALIEQQIEILQVRIAQLQKQEADKAAAATTGKSAGAAPTKSSGGKQGREVDVYA